ncbi:MAG: PQQ-binding-like beta-propeller repeat protein [Candidatus Omnitrophica bacterium]|nr:PQQ-binding-like beta-propeller repeat protein [Candidatus Omnitrophota bacterium]
MARFHFRPRLRTLGIVGLVGALAQVAASEVPETLAPVATYTLPSKIGGPATLFPSTSDARGLAVPLVNGEVLFLSSKGDTLWTTRVGDSVLSPAAVGNLDGQGSEELLVVADLVRVVALDWEGRELWRYTLEGEVGGWRGPTCADLDGDGATEVLVSDDGGWLTCLSGNGKLRWRIHPDSFRIGQPSVGDVDGDGTPEIVFGTENNRLICLNASGDLRWLHRARGKFGRSYVALADLDQDGLHEAVWSQSFNEAAPVLYAARAWDGAPLWSARTILHGYGSCSVADIDSDGDLEVTYCERANTLYAFDHSGKELWRTTTGGRGYMHPHTIADIDGDGSLEILAVCRDSSEKGKAFFILDAATGGIRAAYPHEGRNSYPPLVADWDQDGKQELILATWEHNKVEVYRFGAEARAAAPWPVKRANSSRTGYIPSTVKPKEVPTLDLGSPESLSLKVEEPVLWGTNHALATTPAGTPERGFVRIKVSDPTGVHTSRILSVDAEHPLARLPFVVDKPGDHLIEVSLWDEGSAPARCLAKGSLRVNLPGVESLKTWTDRKLGAVRESASDLLASRPEAGRMLLEKASQIEGGLDGLVQRSAQLAEDDSPARIAFAKEIDVYRTSIERLQSLGALAARSPNRNLAIWEDSNPWDETHPLEEPPAELSDQPRIAVWACLGEVEHRVVNVANLRSGPLDVQFRLPLRGPLSGREVVQVPRRDGSWIPDALPRMNQSSSLHLAPGEVRQVWLEVSTEGLAPGETSVKVVILPIGEDRDEMNLTVRIEAEPIHLRDAPEFFLCNWARPDSVASMTADPNAVSEVVHQGMNVWVLGAPGRKCDEQGGLVGPQDWSGLDSQVGHLDPEKTFLLLSGPSLSAPPTVERGSDIWKLGLASSMRELAACLAARGWGLDRWAYYPMDEPGLFGGVEEFTEMVETIKAAAPEIPVYANPAGGVSRENFGGLVDDIDVWAPELAMLRRDSDLAEFFRETGDRLWSYEAPGEVKTLLPLGYYRALSLTAFWMGMTGTGHWVFGYTGGDDLWKKSGSSEYGDMYCDGANLVQSRRWLAYLEGAEDARFLLLLKATAAEAKRRGIEAPEIGEAEELCDSRLHHLIRKQWEQDDIARHLIDYEIDLAELSAIRKETARLTIALRGRLMEGKD